MENKKHTGIETWKERAYKVWVVIGTALVFAGLVYVCSIVYQAVAVIITTALLVFMFHGLVDSLQERGIPRWGGSLLSILIVIAAIVLVFLAVAPAIIEQVSNMVQNSGWYLDQIREFVASNAYLFGSINDDGTAAYNVSALAELAIDQISNLSGSMIDGVVSGAVSAGEVLIVLFVSLLCTYWVLLDLPVMATEVRRLIPDKRKDAFELVMNTMETVVYGWAKATIVCAVLTGVICGIGCALVGVPYPTIMGVLACVCYMIPYVGVAIAALAALIAGIFVSPFAGIAGCVIMIVISNVIANVISPKLMGSAVNVHPALVLVVILAGGAVGGPVGMLLAIPAAATIQALAIAYYEQRNSTKITSPGGALFAEAADKKPSKDSDTNDIPASDDQTE